MSDLESKFNSATDFLGVASLGGVVLSSILLFTPVKAMGYIGIGSGLGMFATSIVTRKKHLQVAEQYVSQMYRDYEAELADKESEIVSLTGSNNDLRIKLKQTQTKGETQGTVLLKLQEKVEQLTVQNQSKDNIVEKVTGELDNLITLARTAVEESLDEWAIRINSLVATKTEGYPKMAKRLDERHPGMGEKLSKHYPKLSKRLTELSDEANQLLEEYALRLERVPNKWDGLGDLLSLYYCVNNDLQNIRIKIVQSISRLTQQETLSELRETEEILEEWQTANLVPRDKLEQIIKNHQAILSEIRGEFASKFNATHQFALALEGQTQDDDKFVQTVLAKMQELEAKIHQLSKPLKYPGAIRSDMKIANIIIGYFEPGIILDRAGTDYRGYEATLEFNSDRTGRLILPKDLNEHSDALQKLTHALNKLEFKLDPETGLLTLLVRWANKPVVDNTDLAKRVITPLDEVVKKLIDNLSHKPTIRVMGATGEGKGVMVRYLLKSILANNLWYCRLHDPQHGSSEDHWGIPKVSKSGSELKLALKAIENQLTTREVTKHWEITTIDVLDEIDTHLEKKEKKEAFIDLISRIRHCGMKLILIGQNPKVGRAGFEWSDMQQMNCVYMGASAFDAIETNPQLKPRKDKLTKDYMTLSEHYEKVNEGLNDCEKYLFGLVVIPGKSPQWVELPRPDSIEITCNELLLGKSFQIPNSFKDFVEDKNSAQASGNSAITNSISTPSAEPETIAGQGMPTIADKADYVGVAGTTGMNGNSGTPTCKNHPDVELRPHKDGRYYCTSCKKRLAKSEVEYL